MSVLTTGARLKSAVCKTEVMVIKAPSGEIELTCGGSPMATDADGSGSVDPGHAEGTAIGKRYVNAADDLELLCVKAGDGSLAVDATALTMKGAKKLPSSD